MQIISTYQFPRLQWILGRCQAIFSDCWPVWFSGRASKRHTLPADMGSIWKTPVQLCPSVDSVNSLKRNTNCHWCYQLFWLFWELRCIVWVSRSLDRSTLHWNKHYSQWNLDFSHFISSQTNVFNWKYLFKSTYRALVWQFQIHTYNSFLYDLASTK